MQNWYNFILKIKPDGKAFRSILFSKIFYEVIAYGLNLIKEYAVLQINDQVWYVNDNFDPEPWERRYEINVPETATLEERRIVVKSYMLFPQSENRLSKDYIENSLHEAGYTDLTVVYNPTNVNTGYLRVNDFGSEKFTFYLGNNKYNQFIVEGQVAGLYYYNAIYLVMSLMPLQVGFYDTIEVYLAIALDETLAIALPLLFNFTFGSTGTGDGEFVTPVGIAVNESNIVVCDFTRDDVQIFDLAGTFVSKFGTTGTGDGQFQAPSGIAVNSTNIFVLDNTRDDVQIFDLAGVFVSKFGSTGTGDGQFQAPSGIAVNESNIFVSDPARSDVQIFEISGIFQEKITDYLSQPVSVAYGNSNILVLDNGNDDIQVFTDIMAIALTKV